VLSRRSVMDIPEEVVATMARGARVVHTKKIPICDDHGEPLYLLGISEDITDRKAAQESARLAKLEAERASRAKSEFLSRMSHDLRTPLNAILGFAQLLEMDRLPSEQADSVHQILKGGAHLLELINEVLDIARIEAGHLALSLESVALAEVVPQVVDLMRPLGAARAITLNSSLGVDSSIHVHADRQRVKQVLVNLVANAVKYNRDGGNVTVSGVVSKGRVRVSVTDTGAGIPPQKLSLLFQPFERLGAEQSVIEGTGLGLAVSKGLIEAMGGAIGVDSRVDTGTTFWIDLPQASAPAAACEDTAVTGVSVVAAETSGIVLYVEDNRSNIRLLERLLGRRPGVRLLTALTGEAALDMVRSEHPDLILLDLHLPDMSGEDVLRRLWADPATRPVPVAILSADATTSQSQRLLAAGAVAYLTKPLQLSRLLQLLDERLPVGAAATGRAQ
jgi:signal transduction histidine kinase/CheY-like chemotaxis protein